MDKFVRGELPKDPAAAIEAKRSDAARTRRQGSP
jgi:hypothetical protein